MKREDTEDIRNTKMYKCLEANIVVEKMRKLICMQKITDR